MSEEDLKLVLAKYQQKSFDLFNKTIVLETQVETLTQSNLLLQNEIEKLKKTKRNIKSESEDFQ
jgi:FtsZ-binding cell division protein ZapB